MRDGDRSSGQPVAVDAGDGQGGRTANRQRRGLILLALCLAALIINIDITIRERGSSVPGARARGDDHEPAVGSSMPTIWCSRRSFLRRGASATASDARGSCSLGWGCSRPAAFAGSFCRTPDELIAARALMGIGAAGIFPSTLSLIANVFTERKERAQAIGLWGATAGVGVATGPIVGGWLLGRFWWGSVFLFMVPVAAAVAGLIAWAVPSSRDPTAPPIDWRGLFLSSAGMGTLVLSIIQAPEWGWSSARTLGMMALGLGILAIFVSVERRMARPMLDVGLFRNPRFTAASGSVTVGFFTLSGFSFLITQYFQFVKGYTPLGNRRPDLAGRNIARRRFRARHEAGGQNRKQGCRRERSAPHCSIPTLGSHRVPIDPVRRPRRTDAHGRRWPGPDLGPGDGSDHGGRPQREGRRRIGGQRRHAALRRHARSGGDRQHRRFPVCEPSRRDPPNTPSPCGTRLAAKGSVGGALVAAQNLGRAGLVIPGHDLSVAAIGAFLHSFAGGCRVAGVVAAGGAVLAAALLPARPVVAQPVVAQPGRNERRLIVGPAGEAIGRVPVDERGRLGAALVSFSTAQAALPRVEAALSAGSAPSPDDLAVLNRASAALTDAAGALGVDPGTATLAELEAQLAAREMALGARHALRRLAGATGPGVGATELAGLAAEAARLAAAPSWSSEDRVRSLVLVRLVELADMANDGGDDERIDALDAELRSSLGPAGAPVVLAGARGRLVLPDDGS